MAATYIININIKQGLQHWSGRLLPFFLFVSVDFFLLITEGFRLLDLSGRDQEVECSAHFNGSRYRISPAL